jgi:hypothetical protein
MNLGKLLAAGKNLVNGRGSMAYRESKQTYLPKFGPPKNPFTSSTQSDPTRGPLENPVALVEKVNIANPVNAQKIPAPPQSSKTLATWTTKLNPMAMLHGAQGNEKTFSRQAVQPELSLDSVKVVHNDLTDADVEIVPIKSRPEKIVPDLPPARKSWEILGERLMKATAL